MVLEEGTSDAMQILFSKKRIFSDLAKIKPPQDSSIIITNYNLITVVVQYNGNKESEVSGTKSDFVELHARSLVHRK